MHAIDEFKPTSIQLSPSIAIIHSQISFGEFKRTASKEFGFRSPALANPFGPSRIEGLYLFGQVSSTLPPLVVFKPNQRQSSRSLAPCSSTIQMASTQTSFFRRTFIPMPTAPVSSFIWSRPAGSSTSSMTPISFPGKRPTCGAWSTRRCTCRSVMPCLFAGVLEWHPHYVVGKQSKRIPHRRAFQGCTFPSLQAQ